MGFGPPNVMGREMKPRDCSICGEGAHVTFKEGKGGAMYGVSCEGGHAIRDVFGSRNRAIQAWDECQRFVLRYTEGEEA